MLLRYREKKEKYVTIAYFRINLFCLFQKKLNYSKGWMIPLLYFSNLFQVFYCIFFKIAHLFFNYIIKINNVLNCLQNINIKILFLKESIKEILFIFSQPPKTNYKWDKIYYKLFYFWLKRKCNFPMCNH